MTYVTPHQPRCKRQACQPGRRAGPQAAAEATGREVAA
jgi:hypothetical protein